MTKPIQPNKVCNFLDTRKEFGLKKLQSIDLKTIGLKKNL
tara:strand:+ start:388 stop:507 length:120 start_codon:yes stop_codon:yes gene_type:complete